MGQLRTPVLFLVFNRPDCTTRVFAEIRRARPAQLFVVADGPRANTPEDVANCTAVQKIIDDGVDWECEVHKNYAEANMGCARRVSSGITWFFEQVEEGIILEDDCLPDPSFFPFCQKLLERYRHDSRIGQICGTPLIAETVSRNASYLFSRYGPIWGWASWRRAWKYYDLRLKNWPLARESHVVDAIALSNQEKQKRTLLYEQFYQGDLFTWDYQWGYAKMTQSMLSIIPAVNLIENIGFGLAGTHTTGGNPSGLKVQELPFPLTHPEFILVDKTFDVTFSRAFAPVGLYWRMKRYISKTL